MTTRQSCPRVTFLGPDPTRQNVDPTRPYPRLLTKSLTRSQGRHLRGLGGRPPKEKEKRKKERKKEKRGKKEEKKERKKEGNYE